MSSRFPVSATQLSWLGLKKTHQVDEVVRHDLDLVQVLPGLDVVVLVRPELCGVLQLERVELDLGSVRLRLGRELPEVSEDGFLESAFGLREVGFLEAAVLVSGRR